MTSIYANVPERESIEVGAGEEEPAAGADHFAVGVLEGARTGGAVVGRVGAG